MPRRCRESSERWGTSDGLQSALIIDLYALLAPCMRMRPLTHLYYMIFVDRLSKGFENGPEEGDGI